MPSNYYLKHWRAVEVEWLDWDYCTHKIANIINMTRIQGLRDYLDKNIVLPWKYRGNCREILQVRRLD